MDNDKKLLAAVRKQLQSSQKYPVTAHKLLLEVSCDLRNFNNAANEPSNLKEYYFSQAYMKLQQAIASLEDHRNRQ